MKIEKPIFIVGAGRSGSSLLQNVLAEHPNVSWLTPLCHKYPDKPSMNRVLMKTLDYPIIGALLKPKISIEECYAFWEHYCKGFTAPYRDLLPEDVTYKTKKNIQDTVPKLLTNKRNRLLAKFTGWPRIGFLQEIFNDAKFIHILRDGRAVANSLLSVDWWLGWRGPQHWRWGELTLTHKQEWEKNNKSFIVLAAIQWKLLMDAMEHAKQFVNRDNMLEIKYEHLCSTPLEVFWNIIDFCDLEWSREFKDTVVRHSFRNRNNKWRKDLNIHQQKLIEDVLGDYLERYGYK